MPFSITYYGTFIGFRLITGSYGVPVGMFFNFPVLFDEPGEWTIVADLKMDEKQKLALEAILQVRSSCQNISKIENGLRLNNRDKLIQFLVVQLLASSLTGFVGNGLHVFDPPKAARLGLTLGLSIWVTWFCHFLFLRSRWCFLSIAKLTISCDCHWLIYL